MNHKVIEYFKAAGFPEAHSMFVGQFIEADTPTKQAVVIPPGGGKGHFLSAIAKYVASLGWRVLLLTDRAIIQEQYHSRLQRENAMTINLDRPTMRSLQAGIAIPRVQWQRGCIYTATIQFVVAEDIKPQILHTTWDLIIVEDAHSTRLLTELSSSSAYTRLLIMRPYFNANDGTNTFQGIEVHVLGTMYPDLEPKFKLEIVEFDRTEGERKLLEGVLRLTKQLSGITGLEGDLGAKLIRQHAASSFYALELTLTRMRQTILAQRNFVAHNPDMDGANFALLVSTLRLLDDLLIQLDEIETESKQQALLGLLHQLTSTLVYTNSSDTAAYLSGVLDREGSRALHITGSLSYSDYEVSLNALVKSGGVLFISDDSLLTGYDLRSVLSAVVLYDVPQSDTKLRVVASRVNPQNGRVFLLNDTSSLLENSHRSVKRVLAKLGLQKA